MDAAIKTVPAPKTSRVTREGEEQERYHHWLFVRDVEEIDALVGRKKRSKLIRYVLRHYLNGLRAKGDGAAKRLSLDSEVATIMAQAGEEE